jgi:hypothetical protein
MFKSIPMHEIVLDVQLSEEEKAIIQQHGLGDKTLFTWPVDPSDTFNMRVMPNGQFAMGVKELLKMPLVNDQIPRYSNLADAQAGMAHLEGQLRVLKEMMGDVAAAPKSKSFEL